MTQEQPTRDLLTADLSGRHVSFDRAGVPPRHAPYPEPPVLVTVEEAARRLSIGRTSAYMLVLSGELKSVKIGRTRRVIVASLQEYIAKLLEREK